MQEINANSPSLVFKKIGEMVVAGFQQGLGEDMGMTAIAGQVTGAFSPQGMSVTEGARTVQVFLEPTGDQADQVQLGLMMAGVTERIEWAGSTSFSGRR